MNRRARKVWTKAEVALLTQRYPVMCAEDLAKMLNISLHCLYGKAHRLGLCKSPAFSASAESGRLRQGSDVGKSTRFKPGQVPHNKGKHFIAGGRGVDTQFKSGDLPHNYLPLGSERLSNEGYLERKMTETGCARHDWVPVHKLLWIEQHGPIPQGHVVVFRNRNRADVRHDNLELISRQALMLRNTIHRYPDDLKQVIRLSWKLNRKIRALHEKQD